MNDDPEDIGTNASLTDLALAFAIVGTAATLWGVSICALALWWARSFGA